MRELAWLLGTVALFEDMEVLPLDESEKTLRENLALARSKPYEKCVG